MIFLNSTSQQTQAGSTVFKKETYLTSVTAKRAENIPSPTPTPSNEAASTSGFVDPNLPSLPLSLAQSAFEDNIVGNFWSSYLPNGEAPSSPVFQYSTYGWTAVAQELYKESPLIRVAVLAGAIGLTGQQQHLEHLVQQSRQLYGWVLTGVNGALREPGNQDTHIIQTALRLLGFYEVSERTCLLFVPLRIELLTLGASSRAGAVLTITIHVPSSGHGVLMLMGWAHFFYTKAQKPI